MVEVLLASAILKLPSQQQNPLFSSIQHRENLPRYLYCAVEGSWAHNLLIFLLFNTFIRTRCALKHRITTGNPGSLCVGKYREHMRRSLGLKIC